VSGPGGSGTLPGREESGAHSGRDAAAALAARLAETAARLGGDAPALLRPAAGYVLAGGRTLHTSDPGRVASLGRTAAAILAFFEEEWAPGDVAVTNDPFHGGVHVAEFTAVAPAAGGAVAVRVRFPDIGGFHLGGLAPNSFDLWGEGARITPVKIALGGRLRREALELLALNSRTPRLFQRLLGDMRDAVLGLVAAIGATPPDPAPYRAAAEAAATALGRLRPGRYTAEAPVETPGTAPRPVVRLVATAGERRLTLDFGGSDAQIELPVNSTPAHTLDCCLAALAESLPGFPLAGGAAEALTLVSGHATVTGAAIPAATGLSLYLTARAIRRAVAGVLGEAGAPVDDPDAWWRREGEALFAGQVDPATLQLYPGWVEHLLGLEQKEEVTRP
jgi:N-methylhydantoinase B/oxoprolinase/acetone carboxylase alpha subunit